MPLAQQGSRQHTSSGTGSTTTGTTSSHENPNSITELRSKSRRTNNAPGWGGGVTGQRFSGRIQIHSPRWKAYVRKR